MKLKLAAALVAGTTAITLLAGCPLPETTPVDTTPEEEKPLTFDANALLAGEISGGGQPFYFEDYTPYMEAKVPGAGQPRVASASIQTHDVTSTKKQMYYQFTSGLTEGNEYQVIWEYKGTPATKSAEVNTIQLFVTDPVTASKSANKPNVLPIDIFWEVGMKPDFEETITASDSNKYTFRFNPITNLNAEYQIAVFERTVPDNGPAQYSAVWSSEWLPRTVKTLEWNGRRRKGTTPDPDPTETNNPTGNYLTGKYYYAIKFRKEGGEFNGKNFYGQTQYIPFTVSQ